MPQNGKAHDEPSEEIKLAYAKGVRATLCDLHLNDVISTDIVQAFQKNYENSVSNPENIRQAAKNFGEIEVFKDCPLLRY
ncbi:hypothetical protein [Synechococcus sp. MIT S1220]|uniref:hypothetical protein n=1 Tax=Synechococcus sp. MIT S1220 TaxID=3082549 RepID=UPI0039B00AE7